MMGASGAANSIVIARLDRAIQYAAWSQPEPKRFELLDARFRGHDEERGSHV
jgi:hypothetical protein